MTHVLAALAFVAAAEPAVDFNRDVRPILADKCFACHGPDEKHRAAKLRLDVEAGARAVVDAKSSRLLERITSADEAERMPPRKANKPLTPREVETLRAWVAQGAPYARHWAYVPPRRPPIPAGPGDWTEGPIDRFLLDRLRRAGRAPAADAEPVTLIRRLSFDLIGLPPTPDEVADFTAEYRRYPRLAVERAVDRLLASPHWGERMAIPWLDLVRYADTVGYHGDQEHSASPYRDWVIEAFNRNLPFDRFTRDQLAGDLAPGGGVPEKVATCYNRLLQTSHEGGVQANEYLTIYAADRVRNVSAVWLGGTVGCAQCHDHKYDPFTMKDFYSLAAFFADVNEIGHLKGMGGDTSPTRRPPEMAVRSRDQESRLRELDAMGLVVSGAFVPALTKERERVKKAARLVMVTEAVKPRTVRILPRGNWLDESGPEVQPAVPASLGRVEADRRLTRLDLANWLTDPKAGVAGLTARVVVNRLWAMYFGIGLSKSLDDFGAQGEAPVHPELLDYLALEFVESGWDVKRLVRQIVVSHAYRQSSRVDAADDPENRLYGRQARYRLPAEMVRDNALAVSGLLVREVGGGSARPYQPAGYYRHLNFPTRDYRPDTDTRQYRRGVYTHWQRQYLHPMLRAFDAPSREECTAQRPRSNTPLAALVLLNDPSFVEAARALADRTLEADGTDDDRIAYAFRQATGRGPDRVERGVLKDLLEAERAEARRYPERTAAILKVGLRPGSGNSAERTAWTAVARALLNLGEAVMRE